MPCTRLDCDMSALPDNSLYLPHRQKYFYRKQDMQYENRLLMPDYNIHMITIDKNSEIKIWNDENMQRLTRIDPTKEKGED